MSHTVSVVALLDIEPGLGRFVGMRSAAHVGREARLPVIDLAAGAWPPIARPFGALALAVVSGLLRTSGWLLGPRDRFDPWTGDERWTACTDVRVAVLGSELTALLRPWPSLAAKLASRRTCGLPLPAANQDDAQLLDLLWRVAQRWGTVAGDDIILPVSIDIDLLACLTGGTPAQLSGALRRLAASGSLLTSAAGAWRLHGGDDVRARVAHGLAFARAAGDGFAAASFASEEASASW